MYQGNTGGIIAISVIAILVLLGVDESGILRGAKQDILAFLEIFK